MNRIRFLFVGAVLLHLLSLVFDNSGSCCQMAVAPIIVGAGLAAGGSILNSVIGNSMARSNAKYQADLQKDLMNHQWDLYGSPKAQASALADAGFNPSVVFGQGGLNTAQPNASAPAVSPVDIGLSGSDLANSVLALSQAKKAGAETIGQNLENKLNTDIYSERVREVALQNKWTAEKTAKVTQEIGLMSGLFNKTQKEIEKLSSEKLLVDKNVKWFDRHMSAEINDIKASADYKNALKGLTDSQKELLDSTMEDLKNITHWNAEQMETIVGLLNKYGDAQAIVGLLSNVISAGSDLIGSIASFKNINKVVETVTGSTTQKSDGSWSTTNTRTTRK